MDLRDPSGRVVHLRGCNVGNWLVIEPWMLDLDNKTGGFSDQYELEQILKRRFGDAERERLMDLYRSSWMTERDWNNIQSFRFNVVRLPINYRLLEDDSRPFELRKDAWEWLDKAVNEAERHGLYTILDMHGAQGGQSEYDHTGRSGQNKLWADKKNQERLAWLWGKIAARYRNRSAVVAYDVFNEPYGGTKADQIKVFRQALAQIRAVDPEKLVYAHGSTDTFTHYGKPKDNGWKNVGFEMHYYPGLFGGGDPTLQTQARHLRQLKLIAEEVKSFDAPFLVGEMNVVFAEAGGGPMMRKTFDLHESFGWSTTMWAYKLLNANGGEEKSSWGMYTNAKPIAPINFGSASKAQIEKYFAALGTMPLLPFEPLKDAMTAKVAPKLELPALPDPIASTSHQDELPGWKTADVGGALKGGLEASEGEISLFGGGGDIWGREDQFRFLYREVSGDFELSVEIRSLTDTDSYAKAGLMVRANLDPSAATALISTFPSGNLQVAIRKSRADEMAGVASVDAKLPAKVRITRIGDDVALAYENNGSWQVLASCKMAGTVIVGPVALSHDNRQLANARYRSLKLEGNG
jgi:glucan 1,3-beta-glucosidase